MITLPEALAAWDQYRLLVIGMLARREARIHVLERQLARLRRRKPTKRRPRVTRARQVPPFRPILVPRAERATERRAA